jgi:hypothetical protein
MPLQPRVVEATQEEVETLIRQAFVDGVPNQKSARVYVRDRLGDRLAIQVWRDAAAAVAKAGVKGKVGAPRGPRSKK